MGIGGTKSISAPMYSVLIQAAGKASKKRFQQTSQKWLIEFERSQAPDDSRMITSIDFYCAITEKNAFDLFVHSRTEAFLVKTIRT